MMDTILNLGLNETSLQGLIKQTGNERFAYDTYRRSSSCSARSRSISATNISTNAWPRSSANMARLKIWI